jgi:hypothetical protein
MLTMHIAAGARKGDGYYQSSLSGADWTVKNGGSSRLWRRESEDDRFSGYGILLTGFSKPIFPP